MNRYGEAGPKGRVMTVVFDLDGQEFIALNGGPLFKFTRAISCKTQEEVDTYGAKLLAGGEESRCGWRKDKLVCHGSHARMKQIDIAQLKRAYDHD